MSPYFHIINLIFFKNYDIIIIENRKGSIIMSTTIERIIGEETVLHCVKYVQELVDVWMKDNDISSWENLVADSVDFSVADEDYHFQVRTGATKIVLVPDNTSYVIKIPFIGAESWDNEHDFYPFNGGDYDNEEYDYCAHEAFLYDQAEMFNCDQFFVPTMYLTTIYNIPIYIQTKIEGLKLSARPSDEDTFRYASIKNSDVLDPDVGAKLLRYYPMEEVAQFLLFIKEFEINDLEAARNGEYVAAFGRYVFWDYCGYKERDY